MKHFNFNYGPSEGEKVIKRLAEHLKLKLLELGWLSRIGGDEFLCLFNCDLQEAEKLIEKLQQSLKELIIVDNAPEVQATFKIGLTTLKKGDTPESCLRRLEDAVHNIRNQLVIV
jgi:diguanylate cyclase